MDWALTQGGLGLVVLSGDATFNPGTKDWHDNYKAKHGQPRKGQKSDKPRDVKANFTPRQVHFFFP